MSPPAPVAQEPVEEELTLLIREARLRQRRRRLSRVLGALVIAAGSGLAALVAAGLIWPTAHAAPGGRSAALAAGTCPSSPARFVANSVFTATVLGRGPIRLALGQVYLKRSRRVILGSTNAPGWSAMEVIWVRESRLAGTLTVRGRRLGKPGTINVGPSNTGVSPGSAVLSLPPGAINTAPGGVQLYPGSIWVRSGGCYALTVSGRGLRERIVLNAQQHR